MSSVPKGSSNGQASNGKPISKRMARNLERLKNLKSNTPTGKAIGVTQTANNDPIQQAGASDIRGGVIDAIAALGGDTLLVHSAWPGPELSQAIAELQMDGIASVSGIATALMNRAPDVYCQRVKAREAKSSETFCVTSPLGDSLCVTGVPESESDVTHDIQEPQTPKRLNETQRDPTSCADASLLDSEGEESLSEEKARSQNAAVWFKETVSLPFSEFVIQAWYFNNAKMGLSEWSSPIFWFVYILRGHPEMVALDSQPTKAFNAIEKELAGWTRQYRKDGHKPKWGDTGDVWHDWFYHERADAIAEFSDLWAKIRYRPGHEPLEIAVAEARKLRLLPSDDVAAKREMVIDKSSDQDYTFFLSVAGHLQIAMGDQNIMLPCVGVGRLLRVSKMTISRYCRYAMEDGYLTIEKPYQFRSMGGSKATEYRFDVKGWEKLSEKAAPGLKS